MPIEDAIKAANAIKEARGPIILDLNFKGIDDADVQILAEAIKVARVPLTLNLLYNKISKVGIGVIADVIKVAQVPLNLNLCLSSLEDAGAGVLADAIKVAQVPITLNLMGNKIRNAGASMLADAIKVARVPLTLDLSSNCIGDAGAGMFAEAIKVAQVPIILNLKGGKQLREKIGNAGLNLLAEAMKVARVPLVIYSDNNEILSTDPNSYFIIDARLYPDRFLNRVGFRLSLLIEETLGCPSVLASLIRDYYIFSEDVATMVVTAIRAIDGASHDNIYSSINMQLLYELYPGMFSNQLQQSRAPSSAALEFPSLANGEDEVKEAERNHTAASYEDDGGSPEDNEVSSSSSSSSGSPPPGGKQADSEKLPDQEASLSSDEAVNQPNQASHLNNEEREESDTEALYKTLVVWIKDLPEGLQQQMFSSFSVQQILEFLEAMLNPNKSIEDQLSGEPVEKAFEFEYKSFYGQDDVNATDSYARSVEPDEVLSKDVFITPPMGLMGLES